MKRWWCSWHGPADDYRCVGWPPDSRIIAYWCSGYAGDGSYSTLVAWVEAPDEHGVAEAIASGWPEWDCEWRIEPHEKPEAPSGGRFNRPDWCTPERWAGA